MTNIQIENLSEVKKKNTFEVPEERVLDMKDSQYPGFEENRPN